MIQEVGRDEITHDPRSVVTVGTYDGVHVGHQEIIRFLTTRARVRRGTSVVVTFEPHPREVLSERPVPRLTTLDERAARLEMLGLDRLVVVPFTRDFARVSAEEFVTEWLIDRVGLLEMVVGHDHLFGHGRGGDRDVLDRLGRAHGFSVEVIPPQTHQAEVVSSTRIRELLEEGDVYRAAELLGRPYALRGRVVRGQARGRRIGFPTANLDPLDPRKIVPRLGVYAVRATREADGERYGGMMNIGVRPTFEDAAAPTVEVFLMDFEGELYGEVLRVEFVQRIRDERRFESLEALIDQLKRDHAHASQVLGAVT